MVRNTLLSKKDIIILKIYKNYLRTLRIIKTYYNNFRDKKLSLVNINRKDRRIK